MLDVSSITSCEIGRGREATVYFVRSDDIEDIQTLHMEDKTIMRPRYFALRVPRKQRRVSLYKRVLCAIPGHPHVVDIYAVDGATGLMLLEYVGGGTLADELVCDIVSPARAMLVIAQVLRGLAHLHAHDLMHGDVSPTNVLLGDRGECKLTDYFVESSGPFTVYGAPAYMAPEAARGDAVQASDIWSVACLMLAVSGRPPWGAGEARLEDGSVVDLGCAGALLYHLACREIALRGPPEFVESVACEGLFSDMVVCMFTAVEGRVSASELLVNKKWCLM